MKVLWAGYGDMGAAATPALVDAGHEVVALRRTPIDDPPVGVTPVAGDLNAPDGLGLPAGISACIVSLTPDTRDQAGYQHAYVHAVANLHALLQGEISDPNPLPTGMIFVSSTAVYGQNDAEWVDEKTSPSAERFNGAVMARAERLVGSARWPTTVARLSGIYGPGRTRLLRKVRSGDPGRNAWTNRIHRDDAAAALIHLLHLADRPRVVNVTDTEPSTNDTVLSWLAERMGTDPPPIEEGPIGGKRVDGSLLRDTGFRHRYPTFRDGYGAMLDDPD